MQAAFKIENIIPSSFFGRGIPFPSVPAGEGKTYPSRVNINRYSVLGHRFYLPVAFVIDRYVRQLPWEPTMSISTQKTIVETVMAGNTKRGTVKELINTQDYTLSLQGFCYDETHDGYPFGQVEDLKEIFEYEGAIEILSDLTDLFDIKNVVIKSYSFPGQVGKPYLQPFSIEMVSDEDFILIQK